MDTGDGLKRVDVVKKPLSLRARTGKTSEGEEDGGRGRNDGDEWTYATTRANGAGAGTRTTVGKTPAAKFLPWLTSRPTLEGTLEKQSIETTWWSAWFGNNREQWQLRHFMLFDTHLFWGKGFSTMHGYGTVMSAREVPSDGPTAFMVEVMAVPKKSFRRSLADNPVDFMQLVSGLCCKPAGFKQMVLRAGTVSDMRRWIEAIEFGITSSPISSRMPLECSEEIPPSPRISNDTESDISSFGDSFSKDHIHHHPSSSRKKYQEPPPPLSPRPRHASEAEDSLSDESAASGLSVILESSDALEDEAMRNAEKALSRVPSALKKTSSLKSGDRRKILEGRAKSVSFNDKVETKVIAKSPSKLGLAAAEESDKEYKIRTRLSKAAGKFRIDQADIRVFEKLGIGSFGVVYKARWRDTDVAYKTVIDDDMNVSTMESFADEIKMMRALRHPNIVLFLGAVIQPKNMGIISELMKRGNLEQILHGQGRSSAALRENGLLRRQMAADCARGMLYLHSLGIVHHDLKPANLLVDTNWTLKVSDFGMSALKQHTYSSDCKAPGGTPEWMAPESLRGDDVNELSDVYSFGVILWELITLNFPWKELPSPVQIVAQVAFLHRRLKVPSWVEPPMSDLLHDCWERESLDRPSFSQIVERLVGEYPSTWSAGQNTVTDDEHAANILASMSITNDSANEHVSDEAGDSDEFVDASDTVDVHTINEFAPRGLKPIRVTTSVIAQPTKEKNSEDDSPDDSFDHSSEERSPLQSSSPNLRAMDGFMSNVEGFQLKLSPLKTPRPQTN